MIIGTSLWLIFPSAYAWGWTVAPAEQRPVLLVIIPIAFLAGTVVGLRLVIAGLSKLEEAGREQQQARAAHARATERWENAFYCPDHDRVFVAGEPVARPLAEFHDLLYEPAEVPTC